MEGSESEPQAPGPLAGVRVAEVGTLIAGPFCGQLLADMGAEVIKVEEPTAGDPMRQWGRRGPQARSPWWSVIGRNKKSVTLNLRTEVGQRTLLELVDHVDVLIENFRPGTLERWNLAYDVLADRNPGLVLVRVSGFGQTGPYANRAGYDSIGEALGGLRYVTGDPSTPPSRVGISIGDSLAATMGALGALAALQARHETGRGQVVDSAIYESVLAYMESLVADFDVDGVVRERSGPILPGIAPSNVYTTADGEQVLVAANQDTVFKRLAEAMEAPELAEDPRYATHEARGRHQRELDERIDRWTREWKTPELLELLERHGVPAGQIYRAPEMLADPHFAERDAIVSVPDPEYGSVRMQNVTPKLSDTPGRVRWVGPELGAHNEEVLGQLLGMSPETIAAAQA